MWIVLPDASESALRRRQSLLLPLAEMLSVNVIATELKNPQTSTHKSLSCRGGSELQTVV